MLPALLFYASLVNDVRALIQSHNLAAADRAVRVTEAQSGATPEVAAAISWLARGSFANRDYERADQYASETRKLALELLKTRKLDDAWLATALGASIEVHAQVLDARGERDSAVRFLRGELAVYAATPIGERIRKNLNLLDLTGKPAPALDEKEWLGARPVPLASLRGHPVLLFFWAHWCPDCKSEAPVLASVMREWGAKGLVLIAPTRLYGYAARGEEAPPAAERQYIERVRHDFYPVLTNAAVPLSAANFLEYGCSTTPTVVLIDPAGVVRLYHPGAITEQELSGNLRRILAK